MSPAVAEVDADAERHPDYEPDPRVGRQGQHLHEGAQRTGDANKMRPGRAKRAMHIRIGVAEHEDTDADDNKRQQRADRDKLAEEAYREEAGDYRGDRPRENGRHRWSPEARVHG